MKSEPELAELVATVEGVEVTMAEKGFGTRVRKGEAPAAASTLLPAGIPERPTEKEPMRRPDFEWSPVDRALGYRLEIATTIASARHRRDGLHSMRLRRRRMPCGVDEDQHVAHVLSRLEEFARLLSLR